MANLDFRQFRRAPSHRKPKMPGATELAAMLAAGETLEEVAATFERHTHTLIKVLNEAGYSTVDGRPLHTRPGTDDEEPPTLGRAFEFPAWFDDALCAQTGQDLFFPEQGGSSREAKSVCRRCTVAAECLDYALDNHERFGIWGGLSERERRSLAADLNSQQEPA